MYQRKVFERYLRPHEEQLLLRYVAQFDNVLAKRDHAWMRLMRNTGVRVCVVVGLTVNDARQALRTDYLAIRGEINKGGAAHRLFVTKQIRRDLTALLRIRAQQGHAEAPDGELVMSRQLGKGISVRALQQRMQKWVKESGLPVDASPHWWRHTLAKRVLAVSQSKDPQGVIQHLLGHADRRSTVIYTQPDRDDVEQDLRNAQS